MLDNKPNQPSKFKTNYWVEINDDSHEKYSTGSKIQFKILMLSSNLCDFSEIFVTYLCDIFVKETITVLNTEKITALINRNKKKKK